MRPINATRILVGTGTLFVGLLLYLIDRPPDQTYFLFRPGLTSSLHHIVPPLFGYLGGNLPAFLHVFALVLITGGILACGRTGSLIVAVSWFATDVAFELGQKFPAWAERLVPRWFDAIPILDATRNYFRFGTFDALDILAVAIGAAAAYGALLATMERRSP
jgi:hypothetical protein